MIALALILAGAAPGAVSHKPTAEAAAAALNDPAVQQIAALEIASLAGIVLDTKVGALAALTDPRDHVRPGDTLRDVVRRRDPDAERHLYEQSRRAVATAGAVAAGSVAEAAEISRTAARLRAALAPLIGTLNGPTAR